MRGDRVTKRRTYDIAAGVIMARIVRVCAHSACLCTHCSLPPFVRAHYTTLRFKLRKKCATCRQLYWLYYIRFVLFLLWRHCLSRSSGVSSWLVLEDTTPCWSCQMSNTNGVAYVVLVPIYSLHLNVKAQIDYTLKLHFEIWNYTLNLKAPIRWISRHIPITMFCDCFDDTRDGASTFHRPLQVALPSTSLQFRQRNLSTGHIIYIWRQFQNASFLLVVAHFRLHFPPHPCTCVQSFRWLLWRRFIVHVSG